MQFPAERVFAPVFMFHYKTCNKSNYHAKHDRKPRKQLQARSRLQAFWNIEFYLQKRDFGMFFAIAAQNALKYTQNTVFSYKFKVKCPKTPYCTGNCKHNEKSRNTLQNRLRSIENLSFDGFQQVLKHLKETRIITKKSVFSLFLHYSTKCAKTLRKFSIFTKST